MPPTERTALIACQDDSCAEAIGAALRRSNLSIRRVVGVARSIEAILREPVDLVVVAFPIEEAARVLAAARGTESANRRCALVAVVVGYQGERERESLPANRVVAADCSPAELQEAVSAVLEVAPRAEVAVPIKLRFSLDQPFSVGQINNLSVSGMLVGGLEAFPVGSEFGFELVLPGGEAKVLGRAEVVRHSQAQREGVAGLGANFIALGGEGEARLRALVEQRLDETASAQDLPRNRAPELPSRITDSRAWGRYREELEELTRVLDGLLARGLQSRFEAADWYVTGAELGLESLHAFYRILEAVYTGTTISSREGEQGLDDLRTVHRELGALAQPEQSVEDRARIMLEIRRPLERLLSQLSETRLLEGGASDGDGERGMVSRVATDIGRFFATRRSLETLRSEILELMRPRYLFARRACRRRALELQRRFGRLTEALGLRGPEALAGRRSQRRALIAISREVDRLEGHLQALHGRVYQGRFLARSSGDIRKDLSGEGLLGVLVDVLVEGSHFLVRANTVYRHALEAIGSDPGLLDRSTRLARLVEAAPAASPSPSSAEGSTRAGDRRVPFGLAPRSRVAQA